MPESISLPTEEDFATVLTRAIARRNLTLDRLSARLRAQGTPVSIATLSYWQTGRSVPTRTRSLKAVEHLERILGVPPGQLVRSLPGDPFNRWDPQAAVEPQTRLLKTLETMGLDLNRHSTNLSLQESHTISPDGLYRRGCARMLVKAEEDGWNRTLAILTGADADTGAPAVHAGRGCRLGQVETIPEDRMTVVEVLLAKTLQRGDLIMFDYWMEWQSKDQPVTSFERTLATGAPFMTLEATFLGEPPAEAAYFTCPSVTSPDDEVVYTPVTTGQHIQYSAQNAPAGVHGLGWKP